MIGSQRFVLILGLVLLAGCLLYPPWHFNALPAAPNPVFRSLGYAFLFSAPRTPVELEVIGPRGEPDREGFLRSLEQLATANRRDDPSIKTGAQPAPPPFLGPSASLDFTLLFTQMGAVAALTGVAFVALGWRRKP